MGFIGVVFACPVFPTHCHPLHQVSMVFGTAIPTSLYIFGNVFHTCHWYQSCTCTLWNKFQLSLHGNNWYYEFICQCYLQVVINYSYGAFGGSCTSDIHVPCIPHAAESITYDFKCLLFMYPMYTHAPPFHSVVAIQFTLTTHSPRTRRTYDTARFSASLSSAQ